MNGNNTFAIVYEDGEFELKAKEGNIRSLPSSNSDDNNTDIDILTSETERDA